MAGSAQAAPAEPAASKKPVPPASMSTVGGDRLGLPGTQVDTAAGIPALPKDLTARSWIVTDAETGEVLASHNAHWKLAPASTLKMLLADTVMPKLPSSTVHKVAASDLAGMGEGSSLVGIETGLTYTVHDLWLGVFLRSGNDAVHVLSAMNGGVPATVAGMNAEAHELQADDTHVVSPDGYDEPGQASSAYDLTLFARQGLQNADFRAYCSTVTAQFPGDYKKGKDGKPTKARASFQIQNTDRLLSGDYDLKRYSGIAGVKNGDTTNAGATYTGVAQRGDRTLLVTVMHPDPGHNRVYREAASLLDWGFKAAPTVQPVGTLVPPLSKIAKSPAPSASASSSAAASASASASPSAVPVAAQPSGSAARGRWTAAGIAAGTLLVLAAVVIVVRRRRPLPQAVAASGARRPVPAAGPREGREAPAGPDGPTDGPSAGPTAGPTDGPSAGPTGQVPAQAGPRRSRRAPRLSRSERSKQRNQATQVKQTKQTKRVERTEQDSERP
ncbi:D-alanyl-D-alanine carboxypeptidase family protein [Actinacidiphila yeochonensis]|uniref:D-alanyl-D-alanine carboxypeptidase family protein n=1 Tax=Actinacidiphila yeochonensis TaxID=89050 RepID=UPI001E4F4338